MLCIFVACYFVDDDTLCDGILTLDVYPFFFVFDVALIWRWLNGDCFARSRMFLFLLSVRVCGCHLISSLFSPSFIKTLFFCQSKKLYVSNQGKTSKHIGREAVPFLVTVEVIRIEIQVIRRTLLHLILYHLTFIIRMTRFHLI